MSDSENSEEMQIIFKCKKCPGKTFTAAEKDSHRRMHKEQREAPRTPGPKRKTRAPSPADTDVTLFLPINETPPRSPKKSKPGRPPKKAQSTKKYDKNVAHTSHDGG